MGNGNGRKIIKRQHNVPFKDMVSTALLLFSCFAAVVVVVVALSHLMVMSWTRAYSRLGGALRRRFTNKFRSGRMWKREDWQWRRDGDGDLGCFVRGLYV